MVLNVILFTFAGCAIFLIRLFIGLHTLIVACLLRKSTIVRCTVLRIMCAVLGVVVRSDGERFSKVGIICANHVSTLDHLAVELVKPCDFFSVWNIPSVVKWCFGYLDLDARIGHAEFVRRARDHLESSSLPLLVFPEGAITSGRTGMLKFRCAIKSAMHSRPLSAFNSMVNRIDSLSISELAMKYGYQLTPVHFSSWPCEASSRVQPLAVRISRPLFSVSPSVLGSTWWADVAWFAFVPLTVYHFNWLPVMERGDQEAAEDFSKRVEFCIAEQLGLKVTNLTHVDAIEAAKRFLHSRTASTSVKKGMLDIRTLDDIAMRIKQSYPSVSILDIRMDLERTKDQQVIIAV
ncbi:unnamed protein product [Angiostrongylus costaricensis]|uniref:PlsC domain-containing protein n=1 Tax=Angiostrongylus costaricensis TaxID=334426 RepID=A0A0R3PEL3_ANGCS|nr:unnamed protein product [Angiostrongylus costaricensis]